MLAGAYSNRFRLLQEQQLQKLKILNAAAGDAAFGNDAAQQGNNKNGSSRQLSLETNKRRKVQEKRQKMVALKEEKRRQEILLHRRQLQQDATERFQRAPIQNNKNRTTRANLDDLLSIIRGGSSLCYSTVHSRKQRSSSARVLPKDRDKSNNTPSYSMNKLLNNRPSSQPSRTFPNAQLHDQSLKNLANSRNLFEQQLRQKLQQQNKPKECEQVPVTPEGTEDTDSENDLFSVDSVEAEARQVQVVGEQGHFIGSIERNGQKQKPAISNGVQTSGYKTESEAINIQLNPAEREAMTCTHPIRQTNDIQEQQQQQFPSDPQKNSPASITLASGDGKNATWSSQTNENLSFQKTAWIQPSLIANDNRQNGFHQPMPAWINLKEAAPYFDNNCQTNTREVNDNQNCSQQQTNGTVPLKGKPPICGAPIKPTVFQPKHNYYERQLSTTLHPIMNNLPQQRPVRVNERESQSKVFTNSLHIEPYQEQTRSQGNSDAATTNSKAAYSQNRSHIPIPDKKKPEENKLKYPHQTRPIEHSERNCDDLLKPAEKSENNNNAVIPQDHIGNQTIISKQMQVNPQPPTKSKIKKNDAWQESGRKIVSKKQPPPPTSPAAVKGKPIRSILKVTSAGLSISPTVAQRREVRDSLEITRLLFNPGETTETKTRSKSGKKHVHFAAEDQFCELDDNLEMTSNVAEEKNPPSFDNCNNYNNHTQQQNGNVHLKLNINGKEPDKKDVFSHKSWQKTQINWVQPNERPQAKAHIIKHTPQVAEEGPKITDPTHSNGPFTDNKKGNNERQPSSKSNDVQYITMGTLKKMATVPNNQGISHSKNPQPRKEIDATITEEQNPSFPKSNFPVDKTPTDDEITWLWDKVQMCLQQKVSSKPAAPQNAIRSKPIMSHMYVDGGILGKCNGYSVGGKTTPLSPFWHPPTRNGGVTLEGQMTANYAKRLALLHRRTSPPVPRVPLMTTGERVPPLPSEAGTPPSIESRFPAPTSKEVTGSLAVFLKAEELSRMVSVTDSQALVAMKEAEAGSPFQGGVPPKYRGSPSILSLEEKRLMESLERINNKLKGSPPDYGQIAMNGLPKHLFLTDQLTRYQIPQPSTPSQMVPPKGWLKGTEP